MTKKLQLQAKSIRRGTKEVSKSLRKGEKGFVIIAGDISPIGQLIFLSFKMNFLPIVISAAIYQIISTQILYLSDKCLSI